MDFSNALVGMKRGHNFRRESWPEAHYVNVFVSDEGNSFRSFDEKGIGNWEPQNSDIFAEDWVLA